MLRGHGGAINQAALAADGRVLASASDDRTVRLWPLPERRPLVLRGPEDYVLKELRVWRRGGGGYQVLGRHDSGVYLLALSPDGKLLASAGEDSTVRVWELASGSVRVLRGHSGAATRCAAG